MATLNAGLSKRVRFHKGSVVVAAATGPRVGYVKAPEVLTRSELAFYIRSARAAYMLLESR